MTYQILHKETPVAQIDTQGHCHIFSKKFMPYNFYLEETNNDPINNLSNFYFWCANRILPANRQHRDVILKSLNLTSKEPAQIALLCHCLSLTDVYWVRTSNESIAFQDINLYDNHAENSLIDASLLGKQITMPSLKALKDLSTDGRFPKAWLNNTLLKGGNPIVNVACAFSAVKSSTKRASIKGNSFPSVTSLPAKNILLSLKRHLIFMR